MFKMLKLMTRCWLSEVVVFHAMWVFVWLDELADASVNCSRSTDRLNHGLLADDQPRLIDGLWPLNFH